MEKTRIKKAPTTCPICKKLIAQPETAQKYHKECRGKAARKNYLKRKRKMRKQKQVAGEKTTTKKNQNKDKQKRISEIQQQEIVELQKVAEAWTRINELRKQKREVENGKE